MTNFHLIRSILLAGALCGLGLGQVQVQVVSMYGVPCTYNLTGPSGYTGCRSGGSCNPQMITGPGSIDVSWFETWQCWQGGVAASGGTTVLYQSYYPASGPPQSIPIGMQVNGRADVEQFFSNGMILSTTYRGWDEADWEGGTDFSGPYNYTC